MVALQAQSEATQGRSVRRPFYGGQLVFRPKRQMPRKLVSLPIGRLGAAIAFVLIVANCSQPPLTRAVVIPPVSAGNSRIWIYRNEGPHESSDTPYIRLNSQIIGVIQPNGAVYRDVPPGHYSVTADSYGVPYPNQFAQVDLGAGQEGPFTLHRREFAVARVTYKGKAGKGKAGRARGFEGLNPEDFRWVRGGQAATISKPVITERNYAQRTGVRRRRPRPSST
jgi:hypothetical protein